MAHTNVYYIERAALKKLKSALNADNNVEDENVPEPPKPISESVRGRMVFRDQVLKLRAEGNTIPMVAIKMSCGVSKVRHAIHKQKGFSNLPK